MEKGVGWVVRSEVFMLFFCFVCLFVSSFFFFNDTATTEIYTLSLHDALPIYMINEQEHLLSFISLSKGAVQFLWVWADRSILK